MLKLKQIHGLTESLASRPEAKNFTGVTLADESLFVHNMNSSKLAVNFFKDGSRDALNVDWQIQDANTIKYYGQAFTGDIFITKRA
jgi:hypothetical protein